MASQRPPTRAVTPRDLQEVDFSDEDSGESSFDELESDPEKAINYVMGWYNKVATRSAKYRTGLAYDHRMLLHHHPTQRHPECPERLEVIMETLKQAGLVSKMYSISIKEAQESDVLNVHSRKHLAFVKSLDDASARESLRGYLDKHSAYASEGSVTSAFVAAGAVISAVECLAHNVTRNAMCVVRPPGHHAENSKVCGFCLFDNVAVAASVAIKRFNYQRVLILDWDIHHGNGIQHAFEDNPQVLYVSLHRWNRGDFYPGGPDGGPTMVGVGKGTGYNINIGWNGRHAFNDDDYLAAFESIVMPAARTFQPDLVFVSAGFDAAMGDPLGGCEVTPNGYGQMLHMLSSLASGRVIVALEGGYHLSAISASMLFCANVLLGESMPFTKRNNRRVSEEAKSAILQTIEAHLALDVPFSKSWTSIHRSNIKFRTPQQQQQQQSRSYQPNGAAAAEVQTTNHSPTRHHHQQQQATNKFEDVANVEDEDDYEDDSLHFLSGSLVVKGLDQFDPEYVQQNIRPPPSLEDGRPTTSSSCEACLGNWTKDSSTWVCLRCYSVFCSNDKNVGHAKEHAVLTGHVVALRLSDLSVYDFSIRQYLNAVTNPDLRSVLEVFHIDKFNMPLPVAEPTYRV